MPERKRRRDRMRIPKKHLLLKAEVREDYHGFTEYVTAIRPFVRRLAEQELEAAIERHRRQDPSGRPAIVYDQLPHVIWVAMRRNAHEMHLIDKIQEGIIGVLTGLEGYDPEQRTRFGNFIRVCIRYAIDQAAITMDERRPYRIPYSAYKKIWPVRRAIYALTKDGGSYPTNEEIWLYLSKDEQQRPHQKGAGDRELTLAEVTLAHRLIYGKNISWHAPALPVAGSGTTIENLIPADADTSRLAESMDTAEELAEFMISVRQVTARMPWKHQGVARLRLGIETPEPLTLEEIAMRFGVTKQAKSLIVKNIDGRLAERGWSLDLLRGLVERLESIKECLEGCPIGLPDAIELFPAPLERPLLDHPIVSDGKRIADILAEHGREDARGLLVPAAFRIIAVRLRLTPTEAKAAIASAQTAGIVTIMPEGAVLMPSTKKPVPLRRELRPFDVKDSVRADRRGLIQWDEATWGTIRVLAQRAGVSYHTLKARFADALNIRRLEARDAGGKPQTFFKESDAKRLLLEHSSRG